MVSKYVGWSLLFSLPVAALVAVGCSAPSAPDAPPLGSVTSALEAGAPTRGSIVISQIYRGSNDPDASFEYSYVELFNRVQVPVVLDGLTLQTATAGDKFGAIADDIIPLTGEVPPGGAILISNKDQDGGTLPNPDIGAKLNVYGNAGKVAIASITGSLNCGSDKGCGTKNVIDLVGYGGASDREGSQSAPEIGPTAATVRKGKGCAESDNNGADFTTASPPNIPRTANDAPARCPLPDGAPPVNDPPLGEEPPYDAGQYRDAGKNPPPPSADDSGCSSVPGANPSAFGGVLVSLAFALAFRKRRGRDD
jgi:hypothetical protein